ncbi:MAG: ATP cone domain-containing protein [Candidatus Bathyarchaeia archaeon]
MVKIIVKDGVEENFDNKNLENSLKNAGLSERLAQEIAERIGNRVENGWTTEKVRQETDKELRQLQEEIEKAYSSYKREGPMGEHLIGEQRIFKENEFTPSEQPRHETKTEFRIVEE